MRPQDPDPVSTPARHSAAAEALCLHSVRFGYGTGAVVDQVSLAIGRGEIVGLLGPNGAGKTTLLRLAAGALAPGSGRVSLFGSDISSLPRRERARRVAVVPQEARTAFDFTVREIVLMGRAPHLGVFGLEREEDLRAAEGAMEAAEVKEFADARLRELSGGEKQRVLIARALAQEAPLLLLDEPTAFLDLKHRLAIYRLTARLREERGLTVVAVSHDINLASRFCERLVLLHEGRIAADGKPDEVITEARVAQIYGAEVNVLRHPESGTPIVV